MKRAHDAESSAKSRYFSSIFFKITFITILLLVGILSLEWAASQILRSDRWAFPADKLIYEKHFSRYYRNSPNTTRYARHPDLNTRHPLKINAFGLLNEEIEKEKTPGVVRIAIVGDSVTENIGVEASYRMPFVMQCLLNEMNPGKKFEVLNCGVSGYGTDRQYVLYKEIVEQLNPDIVLLQHCANDLRNIYNSQLFEIKDNDIVNIRGLFSTTNSFFQAINNTSLAHFLEDKIFYSEMPVHHFTGNVLEIDDTIVQETLGLYKAILRRFKKDVESQGARFIGLLFWDGKTFWGKEIEKMTNYHNVILNIHQELNIPCLDLKDVWVPNKIFPIESLRKFYFSFDPHWSELGNHVAAIDAINFLNKVLGINWKDLKYNETSFQEYELYKRFPSHHPGNPHTFPRLHEFLKKILPNPIKDFLFNNRIIISRYGEIPEENSLTFEFNVPEKSKIYIQNENFKNLFFYSKWKVDEISLYNPARFHDLFSRPATKFLSHGYAFKNDLGLTFKVFLFDNHSDNSEKIWGVIQLEGLKFK